MHFLRLQIVRFIDESQPGWVAGEFIDSQGIQHTIIDKVPVIAIARLRSDSTYPQPGIAACEILEQSRDAQGRSLSRVTINRPWSLETVNGETEFVVFDSLLSAEDNEQVRR